MTRSLCYPLHDNYYFTITADDQRRVQSRRRGDTLNYSCDLVGMRNTDGVTAVHVGCLPPGHPRSAWIRREFSPNFLR
jgi:hypothetical protein